MRFSVITINRNNGSGLKRTIESVLSQERSLFEFIVIDGASTDNSIEIASNYADEIDCLVSEPDKGIYNAMNKGISKAHGDYVIFMNSGDTFAANDILSQVAASLTDDVDFIIGAMKNKSKSGKYFIERAAQITPYTLLYRNYCHQSTFSKTSVLRELNGYDESIRIAADSCLLINASVSHNKTFKTIGLCISEYDNTGISSQNIARIKQEKHSYFKAISPNVYKDYVWAHKWLRLLPSNILRVIKLKLHSTHLL